VIVSALAAAALAAAAAGCGGGEDGGSAKLDALRGDPMASFEPPRGELVDTDEQEEGESTLGKPLLARHARLFTVPPASSREALDEAVAAAEGAGWAFESEPQESLGSLVALAEKQLETGRARLALTLFLDGRALRDGVEPPALDVELEHLSSG
jgi:hypothetical protein